MVGVRVVIILDSQVADELSILLVILHPLSSCTLLRFTGIHDVTYFLDHGILLKLILGGY